MIREDTMRDLVLKYAANDRYEDLFEKLIIDELKEKEQKGISIDVDRATPESLTTMIKHLGNETIFCTNKNYLNSADAKFMLIDNGVFPVLEVKNSSDYRLAKIDDPFENLVRNKNGEVDVERSGEDSKIKSFIQAILYLHEGIKRVAFIENAESLEFDS